jgi:hypothetical protein
VLVFEEFFWCVELNLRRQVSTIQMSRQPVSRFAPHQAP